RRSSRAWSRTQGCRSGSRRRTRAPADPGARARGARRRGSSSIAVYARSARRMSALVVATVRRRGLDAATRGVGLVGDAVLLVEPAPEIDEVTALAAEREQLVVRLHRDAAASRAAGLGRGRIAHRRI